VADARRSQGDMDETRAGGLDLAVVDDVERIAEVAHHSG
jgi:hypothetical protein